MIAEQSAQGSPATTFSTRLWTEDDKFAIGTPKRDHGGQAMTQEEGDDVSSRYNLPDESSGRILVKATPESVDFLLRSNWGPLTGSNYTLQSQVPKFFTVAFVESVVGSDLQKMIRYPDAFFHRLTFIIRDLGPVLIDAEFISAPKLVSTNAGLVAMTPDDPAPADINVFTMRDAEFRRDPAASNVDIRFSAIVATLDQRGTNAFSMTGEVRTRKLGRTRASLVVSAQISDEVWILIDNSTAGTKEALRVRTTAPSPAKTLTLDFFNTNFQFEETGRAGLDMVEAVGEAIATRDALGNFVTLTLS